MRSAPLAPARALRQALPVVLAVLSLLPARAGAEEPRDWRAEPEWKALLAAEAKALAPLLKQAVKDDLRRQAWYLASRVLAAKPGDTEATAALESWSDAQLLEGLAPPADFAARRDKVLHALGDEYARFGERLEASGVDPVECYPLQLRAHAYGATYGALLAALQQAGHIFAGTFGDLEQSVLAQAAGPRAGDLAFPPEWDDALLRVRVAWPEACCATLGPWRLITDLKAPEALAALCTLEQARRHLAERLGGGQPADTRLVDVVLAQEAATYDRLGQRLLKRPEDQRDMQARSAWLDRQLPPASDRLLCCARDRHNGFAGPHAALLMGAAPVIARLHLGGKGTAWVQGRGAWLLDGLGGALEGFQRAPGGEAGDIDPRRCWRLHAAGALRKEGVLLSWERFLEVDAAKAREWPRRTVKVTFHGEAVDAQEVDVAAAQATALALALLRADGGKGARKLGDVLRDLLKRDSLPDLDKVLGWKKGRWQSEAEAMLDSVAR
ncbi:MAG: hypothetical protein ACKOCB_01620 [Planctomycetia bacterium]